MTPTPWRVPPRGGSTYVIEPNLTVAVTLHATTFVVRGEGMSRQPNPGLPHPHQGARSKAPVTHHT
jgi:hypothetical protein